jgi:hypothetical protein
MSTDHDTASLSIPQDRVPGPLAYGLYWDTPAWAQRPILTYGEPRPSAWCPACHRSVATKHYNELAGHCTACVRVHRKGQRA